MSEIKNGGLDQYGAEPFEQKQFGTAGVEGVKLGYIRMIGWLKVDVALIFLRWSPVVLAEFGTCDERTKQ